MTDQIPPSVQAPGPGKPTSTKWLIGCGIGCLGLILIAAIFVAVSVYFARDLMKQVTAEFEELGYKKVAGQVIEVHQETTEPTLYVGQMVKLTAGAKADVAIVGQAAEIHGTINGNLFFRGQVLRVMPGAVITGNLDVQAQVLENEGSVQGEITEGP